MIAFCVFLFGFRFVTSVRQPLQIVEAMVIALLNVVTIRTNAIAFRRMMLSLTSVVRAIANDLPPPCPIGRKSSSPVAIVPPNALVSHDINIPESTRRRG